MSTRPVLALIHVLSQLLDRWLPPIMYRSSLPEDLPSDIMHLTTPQQWLPVIHRLTGECGELAWLHGHLDRLIGGVPKLAATLAEQVDRCVQNEARYLLLGDAAYPPLLATIERPPLGLTILGGRAQSVNKAIAVVGSRKASPRGLTKAFALGEMLSELGIVVVSGGAFGCDAAVHRGCLAAKRDPVPAVVVFAGGLGKQYPRGNTSIFYEIRARGGLLVSEKLWAHGAQRRDFPVRNRIVSGMATATVVVEAGETSGALITANTALDQGRDVLVVRPETLDVRAAGNDRLIADGAQNLLSVEELVCSIVEILNDSSSAPGGFTVCC